MLRGLAPRIIYYFLAAMSRQKTFLATPMKCAAKEKICMKPFITSMGMITSTKSIKPMKSLSPGDRMKNKKSAPGSAKPSKYDE